MPQRQKGQSVARHEPTASPASTSIRTFCRKPGPWLDERAWRARSSSATSLPFADNSFDVAVSVTVIEEVNANGMLAEMVRVTKPGGGVAVIARAIDMPFLMNLGSESPITASTSIPDH